MPSKEELSKFTLAELQMFAKAAKPPVPQVSVYNKRELVEIMASQRHKAKFHDLRGPRFAFKKKAKEPVRVAFKRKAKEPMTPPKPTRVAFKRKAKEPVRVPFKKKANVKAGNRPRENKGGCKVGRKGESPIGGCKIGKKNPTTKDKTVAKLAARLGREKMKKRERVTYKKK
tara:strand:- start:206 stop:721 length:516 start_codon:yes stop_codon:yes gene_type:complete